MVCKFVIPKYKIKAILGVPRKPVLKFIYTHGRGRQISKENIKKLACERLAENVHMQGFRSPDERGVQGSTPQ